MKNNNTKTYNLDRELLEIENYLKTVKKENKISIKSNNPKKIAKIIIVLTIIFLLLLSCTFFYLDNKYQFINSQIKTIELKSYDKETGKIVVEVTISENFLNKRVACHFKSKNNVEKDILAENNKCLIELDKQDYIISLKQNDKLVSDSYLLSENIINTLEFASKDEKIYLAVGDTYQISVDIVSIGKKPDITWKTSNEKVAIINDEGLIIGINNGTAIVTANDKYNNEIKIEVVISNLIKSSSIDNAKEFLECGIYSEEQAHFLDEILFDRVNKAGKKTRAGVVAAARFLSLEFPYKIGYFLENGRLNPSSGPYADGEGRFYHEGLYLSTDKYVLLSKTVAGPAIWGCPMREFSYEDENNPRVYRKNGLDCSGFVSWSLKNGGFDFGDLGSIGWGVSDSYDLVSLGKFEPITMELLKSGKVKAGDLASVPGHIAIVIGIDENHVYIAEEFYHSQGLTVITFTYEELVNSGYFDHLVLMDIAYKQDGNYKNMW